MISQLHSISSPPHPPPVCSCEVFLSLSLLSHSEVIQHSWAEASRRKSNEELGGGRWVSQRDHIYTCAIAQVKKQEGEVWFSRNQARPSQDGGCKCSVPALLSAATQQGCIFACILKHPILIFLLQQSNAEKNTAFAQLFTVHILCLQQPSQVG